MNRVSRARAASAGAWVALAAVVVGVLSTWTKDGVVTLNGIQGSNDGWLVLILVVPALLWWRMAERGSWVGVVGLLGASLVICWTAIDDWRDGRDALGAAVGYGLLLVLAGSLVLVVTAARCAFDLFASSRDGSLASPEATSGDGSTGTARRRARRALPIAALVFAAMFVLVFQGILAVQLGSNWPPPPDAVTSAGAQAATEEFAARPGVRPHDAALPFARSTAATIEPWVEGKTFFPKIFADVERARSSVHILMFGWREGEVGKNMAALLERKLAEGVEVRVIVDGFGSKPYKEAREMFTGLADAGAQIVVNDTLPLDRDGLYPDDLHLDWRQDEVGHADHRKLYVVDGEVAWTGGAGIEDHFENGGFHDVMVRVTGDVVRQAQAAFLTSFRSYDGPLPGDLSRYFPEPAAPGSTPIVLAQVIPGGHVAASQAVREQIDGSRNRLDVMNPYFTDRDMLERIRAAARRGVRVRLVASETSNNAPATAAFKHCYEDLLAAGAEIWEVPGTVVHAKVVVADDVVSFGTVNLDAWGLYRDAEIAMIATSADAAALFEKRLFGPDIERSRPGHAPSGVRDGTSSWLWDKLAYFL